ncbi:hypothetical protein ACFFJY_14685 [Fictibacillus aquaticus]|nr:hypothetical protein [Fictibacillus aquaticus]
MKTVERAHKLEYPVFLDHYYEFSKERDAEGYFTLWFLANEDDETSLQNVTLIDDEENRTKFVMNERAPTVMKKFDHYVLKYVSIPIKEVYEDNINDKGLTRFNKIKFLSNGKMRTAEIGEVKILLNEEGDHIAVSRSQGENLDSMMHRISFIASQNAVLQSIASPFPKVNEKAQIKINHKQYKYNVNNEGNLMQLPEPIEVKKGERMGFFINLKDATGLMLDLSFHVKGVDQKGKPFDVPFRIIKDKVINEETAEKIIAAKRKR